MDTFKKLVESGLAIVDTRNPNQINSLQSILRFIDTALSQLAKRTNNFKENPMKKHHVKWLEYFKRIITSIVWQLNLILGSQM